MRLMYVACCSANFEHALSKSSRREGSFCNCRRCPSSNCCCFSASGRSCSRYSVLSVEQLKLSAAYKQTRQNQIHQIPNCGNVTHRLADQENGFLSFVVGTQKQITKAQHNSRWFDRLGFYRWSNSRNLARQFAKFFFVQLVVDFCVQTICVAKFVPRWVYCNI